MKEGVKKKEVSPVIFRAILIGIILFGVAILGVAFLLLKFFISGWIDSSFIYLLITVLIVGTVFLAIGIKKRGKKGVIILIVSIVTFIVVAVLAWIFLNNGLDNRQLNRPEPVFQPNQQEFTDEEILDATYSHYKAPQNFSTRESDPYFQLVYESTSFLKTWAERNAELGKNISDFEVCTDDKNQALNWSELYRKNYLEDDQKLLNEIETEKFFEFKYNATWREYKYGNGRSDALRGDILRIRKCSYLNAAGSWRDRDDNLSIFLGIFNKRPVTTENVKELIEYDYSLFNSETRDEKILSSFSGNQGDKIKHTIYRTIIASDDLAGSWLCEKIHLMKSVYTVDKTSGEIRKIGTGHVNTPEITLENMYTYQTYYMSLIELDENIKMVDGECYYAPVRML